MNVKVFKFGGASVNSSAGIHQVSRILSLFPGTSMMVVLSALGKTTNALEEILHHYLEKDEASVTGAFHRLKGYHETMAGELFDDRSHPVFTELETMFGILRDMLREEPAPGYDELHDRIVSSGEYFATTILHHYLVREGFSVALFDARQLIRTDSSFRDARIDWRKTQLATQKKLFPHFQSRKGKIGLTQGFVGEDPHGRPVTLGREGSDFTAAILGYCLRVKEITIWKDVPGILNADPVWFQNPVKLDSLPFHEAIELAFYGAKVIHPKTIKPLENAGISLQVRSFEHPEEPGTLVQHFPEWNIETPLFIRKQNQVLISISPRDFSFMEEENLGQIFTLMARFHIKTNLMQNSAISFSVCTDQDPVRVTPLIGELQKTFEVRFNEGLELYTIRHYNEEAIRQITAGRKVILEQKSRNTVHLVVSQSDV